MLGEPDVVADQDPDPQAADLGDHDLVPGRDLVGLALAERIEQVDLPVCRDQISVRGLHVTTLFLGGNGLTVANGLTTPDLSVAATDRALLRAAERVIVTVDHSKIGRTT